MKREYTKPIVVFEDFCMSTNIAAGCDRKVNNPAQHTCGVPTSAPNITIFISAETGCTMPDSDGMDNNGFCYHVPNEGYQLFNS